MTSSKPMDLVSGEGFHPTYGGVKTLPRHSTHAIRRARRFLLSSATIIHDCIGRSMARREGTGSLPSCIHPGSRRLAVVGLIRSRLFRGASWAARPCGSFLGCCGTHRCFWGNDRRIGGKLGRFFNDGCGRCRGDHLWNIRLNDSLLLDRSDLRQGFTGGRLEGLCHWRIVGCCWDRNAAFLLTCATGRSIRADPPCRSSSPIGIHR